MQEVVKATFIRIKSKIIISVIPRIPLKYNKNQEQIKTPIFLLKTKKKETKKNIFC